MTRQELRAAFQRLKGKAQHCVAAAELLSRLAEEIFEREDTTAPVGQLRAAATRTLQLMAEVDSTGKLVATKSAQQHIEGLGKVYIQASRPDDEGRPTRLVLKASEKSFPSSPQAVFLAVAADRHHHRKLGSREGSYWGYYEANFLSVPLKQPLCLSRGGKNVLLLACYVPQQ